MRIFLDANILFSAAKSDGAVRALLREVGAAGHGLVADAYVVGEALRNLEVKYPKALEFFGLLMADIEVAAAVADALQGNFPAGLPEKDIPVLASAVRWECDVLLTGDCKHFGRHFGKRVLGVLICSPLLLAGEIRKEE